MNVHNLNGTTKNTCHCSSWLKHWETYSNRSLPPFCVERTCLRAPEVGAHVQKHGSTDRRWFIVPLCKKHNAATGTLRLYSGAVLVSANVSQTCG